MLGHEAPGGGARGGHRDLLAEDGAHGKLGAVDAAGHPQAGGGTHERPDQRVATEVLGHGGRIGIEVEQPPAELFGGRAVAPVLEQQAAAHADVFHGELGHARPVRQAQAAPVDLAVDLLDAGHGARRQPDEQRPAVERGADGQAQDEILDHRGTVACGPAGLPGGDERGAPKQEGEAEQAPRGEADAVQPEEAELVEDRPTPRAVPRPSRPRLRRLRACER